MMANACHNETCPYGHGCLQKRLGNMCRAKRRGVPLFQELPSDISTVHLVNTAVFFFNSFQLVHTGACLLYQGHSNEVMCDD